MEHYDYPPYGTRTYGRHDDFEPEDIDGPPPRDYPFDSRPPPSNHPHGFDVAPEYNLRGPDYQLPHSPRRGASRDDGFYPRMDMPASYMDYGGAPPYGPSDYGPDRSRGPVHGDFEYASRPQGYPPEYERGPPPRDEFDHAHSHGHAHDYDRGPPPRDDFDRAHSHGHAHDYDRGPPPPPMREEFERRPPLREEFERRPPPRDEFERRPPPRDEFERRPEVYPPPPEAYPPPPEVYPPAPPPRHVQFEPDVVHHRPEEPRFEPPPPHFEPEPAHFHETGPPPVMAFPPAPMERERSPPRVHEPVPPMPPVEAMPPPPPVMMHERAMEGEPTFAPPMPFEPAMARSPHRHGEYPVDVPPYGAGPPMTDPLYGVSTDHEHVKKKHFEGCKDYWAGFLFLVHFWAVVGVCIFLGVKGIIKTSQNSDLVREYEMAPSPAPAVPEHLYDIRHWAPQLASAAASGWIFAFIWQWLVRTETMIKVCLSLGAVSTGLLGIILLSTGTAKGLVGLIFIVCALFQGLYVHLVRHRIPFAHRMLERTRQVMKEYRSLHVISMWTVFLAMFWLAVWIFGVSGAVSLPYGGWYAALLVLSLAWSMEVLRNIVYVTVAGVVGQYYYEGRGHMPRLPVLRAYQRAWTISFGSVCLGSMFVAPVQTLHAIAKRLANEQGANEFLFSCVNCFLGVLNFLNKHFNKWAFVEVGLHSHSFVKSAKHTWKMFKDHGAMLLINDDLTGAILLTSCIIGGVLTALVGGCWTFATHRYLTVGISIISFFIGFFVTYLTLVVPESAIASYYVCFAEDEATLRKHDEPMWFYMSERKAKLDSEVAD